MINIILFDSKKKTEKTIVIKQENFETLVTGYVKENGKKKTVNTDAMEEFINLIKLKDFTNYIGEEEGHKLYYDEDNYVHFIKDSKEDYLKFLLFNGNNAVLNSEVFKKEQIGEFLKGLKKTTATIAVSIMVGGILVGCSYTPSDRGIDIIEKEAIVWEINSEYMECNSVEDMIARINQQVNLSQDEKEILTNRELLEKAFRYSDGAICDKIGWGINVVEGNQGNSSTLVNDTVGYYNSALTPNTMYLLEGLTAEIKGETLIHEYTHLLTNPACPTFLREMYAVETEVEFKGYTQSSYRVAKFNNALLKSLVSEENLMFYLYDRTENFDKGFKNELLKYISEKQYNNLIKKLSTNDSEIIANQEYNDQLFEILIDIFKSKYGEESAKLLEEIYANCHKDNCYTDSLDLYDMSYSTAESLGLLSHEEYNGVKYQKYISVEEYEANKDFYGDDCVEDFMVTNKANSDPSFDSVDAGWYTYNGKDLTNEQALELGFLEKVYRHIIKDGDYVKIPDGYSYKCNYQDLEFEYYLTPENCQEPSSVYYFDDPECFVTYKISDLISYAIQNNNQTKSKGR